MTFNCSIQLSDTVLRWFYDADQFADYAINLADSYPLAVEAENATYNAVVGGVDIQILAATHDSDQNMASYLSTMTVNVSALQEAGLSKVACGSFTVMSTVRLADIIQG